MTPDLPELPGEAVSSAAGGAVDADTVITAGVLAHADAGHGRHGPIHTHCENCGTKLEGPFCHKCGQHDFEFHRSFRHVFLEVLENFFHFEGKFFTNIVTLLFRPGRLTAAFNAGKRVAQMPPFRLYVFVSLLFFFLFLPKTPSRDAIINLGGTPNAALNDETSKAIEDAVATASKEAGTNTTMKAQIAAAEERIKAAQKKKHDHPTEAHPAGTHVEASDIHIDGSENSAVLRWLERSARHVSDPEYRQHFTELFVHNIPRLLLFCLPLFALYTRVLFRKASPHYLQHLVLALHFHSFVYLWLMFRDGWVFLVNFASPSLGGIVFKLCMLWATVYPVLMLRELFHNGWTKTILKTALLTAVYGLTLCFGFAITTLVVAAMM